MEDDGRGRSAVRNALIEEASTEWVSFLDDDDTVYCEYVQRLEEELVAHPEVDLVHFRAYFIDRAYNVETEQLFPAAQTVEWGHVGICFSVKRELALRYPFIEEPWEDFEFVRRISEEGYNVFFSKYITYKVRH